jgi:hypothetical protein
MKILIADTVGAHIPAPYASLLPNVIMRGHNAPGNVETNYHPHGFFCGWLAGLPMSVEGDGHELVFVQLFDSRARMIPNAEEFLLQVIEQEAPDVVSCSWGVTPGRDRLSRTMAIAMWQDWCNRLRDLQERMGFVHFAAAGNSDNNDPEFDLDLPQAEMPDVANIIGSCNRNRYPSEFSGDGPGVQCLYWGEVIYSPDGNGNWIPWRGTSAATPKAAGVCAAQGFDNDDWREYVRDSADRPDDMEGVVPHPKWGYGNMEFTWQLFAQKAERMGYAMPPRAKAIRPAFHDMELVQP